MMRNSKIIISKFIRGLQNFKEGKPTFRKSRIVTRNWHLF